MTCSRCSDESIVEIFGFGLCADHAQDFVAAAAKAIDHVLRQRQIDPDLGYYISPHTTSFELLCAAQAALTGASIEEVKENRAEDLQPSYRRREADVVVLRRQLEEASDV